MALADGRKIPHHSWKLFRFVFDGHHTFGIFSLSCWIFLAQNVNFVGEKTWKGRGQDVGLRWEKIRLKTCHLVSAQLPDTIPLTNHKHNPR